MDPKILKEEWLKSETHRCIAEKMFVLENGFKINDIIIAKFYSDAFGIHIVFYLDNEMCFVTLLTNSLISKSDNDIYEGSIYDLEVFSHKEFLEVSFYSKSPASIYSLECRELTIGPVFGKKIYI